jgi:RHS repeat-associated protein
MDYARNPSPIPGRIRCPSQPLKPYNRSHMQPAPSTRIPDGFLAAMRLEGEKPHQGLPSRNPAPNPVREVCKFTVLLGMRGQAELNRAGSCCTGKERDTESGNDYFGARYYASSMGRFMSPDWSAQEEPVPYAKLDDPQSLNLYAYVENNPLYRADPDGHCCWEEADQLLQDVEESPAGQAAEHWVEAGVAAGSSAVLAFGKDVFDANVNQGGPASTGMYPTTMSYKPGGRFSPDVKKGEATEADQTCQMCGTKTVPAEKSKKGVTPPSNEGQTDHKKARSKGGDNSPSNAEHVCRKCNREKSDKDVPPAPAPPPPPQPPPPPTTPPAGE